MYIFKLLSLYFLKFEIPARAFSSFQQKMNSDNLGANILYRGKILHSMVFPQVTRQIPVQQAKGDDCHEDE